MTVTLHISQTTNILNSYIHPTFLHVYAKTQPATKYTSHVIAKYVLETIIPTKWGIRAKYLIDFYGRYTDIYVLYMKTLQSTM